MKIRATVLHYCTVKEKLSFWIKTTCSNEFLLIQARYWSTLWTEWHGYLWGAGGYKKSIGPPRVVVVVHCSSHIKSHELQSRYEA